MLMLAIISWTTASLEAADKVDYVTQIKPIFTHHCSMCHGAVKQKGGIRVDAGVLIHKGTDDGAIIAPGKADESLLLRAVIGAEGVEKMPKDGKPLSAEQIALLKRWINEGAAYPKEEIIPLDPAKHWAFNVPMKSELPKVKDEAWSKNPIDAFIAAQHEKQGLTPLEEAEPNVWLRRVYLDLIGLPPTEAETAAFVKECGEGQGPGAKGQGSNPQSTIRNPQSAYDRVVEKLLASPRYGERWGRHWMDIWRYSDWYGYQKELRNSQKHIWRWRDWIIESLNADKPYDRMIVEMLAADEAAPTDQDALRATGFLTRNYYKFNRHVWLDSTVEHTGKAFLGLTLNCARCHDHMYDPVSQEEYYKFRAIFEPYQVRYDRVPGGGNDAEKNGLSRAYDAELNAKTFLFERGNDKMPREELVITPGVPKVFVTAARDMSIAQVDLPAEAYYPGMQPLIRESALAAAEKEWKSRLAAVEKTEQPGELLQKQADAAEAELNALKARIAADDARFAAPPSADAGNLAKEAARLSRQAKVVAAEAAEVEARQQVAATEQALANDEKKNAKPVDDAKKKLDAAQKELVKARDTLQKTDDQYAALSAIYPATSTGRRHALAQWITSKKNPLTARVVVNHIWLRHFGSPLVSTVFDFGLSGKPPTHPQLLDWLAVELMEHNWSHKHIHRLIVTSRAYRMASNGVPYGAPSRQGGARATGNAEAPPFRDGAPANPQSAIRDPQSIDPDNTWLWRMNSRRMEAEIVRDSVIHLAGRLDTTMAGPELDENAGLTTYRRSIYYRHAMEKQMVFLEMFDGASPTECYRRAETIAPQQALAMVNSSLSVDMARLIARDLAAKVDAKPDDETSNARFVTAAFARILSRAPSEQERAACLAFLLEQTRILPGNASAKDANETKPGQIKPSSVPSLRAMENFVHVLLNHHEFVTIR
ncbi:MAG: DUF1553 domain-containing protein [Phycisphaeraceae bacterium]